MYKCMCVSMCILYVCQHIERKRDKEQKSRRKNKDEWMDLFHKGTGDWVQYRITLNYMKGDRKKTHGIACYEKNVDEFQRFFAPQ